MDATLSAGYILGVSKLYNFGDKSVWVGVETQKYSEKGSSLLRGAGNWNVHGGENGYTYLNQIMGAGVGYGSDLHSIQIKYQKKLVPGVFSSTAKKFKEILLIIKQSGPM